MFVTSVGAMSFNLKQKAPRDGPDDVRGKHARETWDAVQTYLAKAKTEGLSGMVEGEPILYPDNATVQELIFFAERPEEGNVTDKEIGETVVKQCRLLTGRAANLFRGLRDLEEGEEVVVEVMGEERTCFDAVFDFVRGFLFRRTSRAAVPELPREIPVLVRERAEKCKHSLVHTYRKGECTIPKEYPRGVHPRKGRVGRPKKRACSRAPKRRVGSGVAPPATSAGSAVGRSGGSRYPPRRSPAPFDPRPASTVHRRHVMADGRGALCTDCVIFSVQARAFRSKSCPPRRNPP